MSLNKCHQSYEKTRHENRHFCLEWRRVRGAFIRRALVGLTATKVAARVMFQVNGAGSKIDGFIRTVLTATLLDVIADAPR